MTTTTTHTDYASMLDALVRLANNAAGVEGADSVGAFHPIATTGIGAYGEFSSLSEWLDDFADTLQDFLDTNGDEIGGWEA